MQRNLDLLKLCSRYCDIQSHTVIGFEKQHSIEVDFGNLEVVLDPLVIFAGLPDHRLRY